MKTFITACNLFLGIFFLIEFCELASTADEVSGNIYFFVFKIVLYLFVSIVNFCYAVNFIKER